MHIAILSKSILDVQSIRDNLKQTVTKNIDAQRINVSHPLAVVNAVKELTDNSSKFVRTFDGLDYELDHYFITLFVMVQDGTYLQILANSRRTKQLHLSAQQGFTCCLISGSLNDWKHDLLDYSEKNNLLLRDYGSRVLQIFESTGINKSLLALEAKR